MRLRKQRKRETANLKVRQMAGAAATAVALIAWSGIAGASHLAVPEQSKESKDEHKVYLVLPTLDPEAGKRTFVEKGCISCHAINDVGGHDAPPIDAGAMHIVMSPFVFAAKMWNHAPGMIAAQEDALGEQVTFTGAELGNMIAFVHSYQVQRAFSEADMTEKALKMMHEHGGKPATEAHHEETKPHKDKPGAKPHGH